MPKLTTKDIFRWASYLGTQVAERVKIGKHETQILKITSCMSQEFRNLLSDVEVFKLMLEKDDPLVKELDEFVIPAIQIKGMGEWQRDTLTDMAMRVGSVEQLYDVGSKGDGKDVKGDEKEDEEEEEE